MAKGDITKRDSILWGYTIDEVKPYVEFIGREILFREAVIGMLGVGKKDEKSDKSSLQDAFCLACKKAKKDLDCENCSKSVTVAKEIE